MSRITIEPEARQRVLEITNQPGFTMETDVSWHGESVIRLIAPSAGRGQPRKRYVIVAATLSDCFRVLAEVTQS